MRKTLAYLVLGIAMAAAGALVVLVSGVRRPPAEGGHETVPSADEILVAYQEDVEYRGLTISYPLDEAVFPPEIVAPTFRWDDSQVESDAWLVTIKFQDGQGRMSSCTRTTHWTPSDQQWEAIKRRSLEKPAALTVLGVNSASPEKILSGASISISTSKDEVAAPLFYREVNLPFRDAVRDPAAHICWRFGAVSSKQTPRIVLEKIPTCANCHSFTADGSTLAMEVDSANDKGSYVIAPVEEEMVFDKPKIITWNDYRKEDGQPTFGLLAQISPDGKYVICMVKDRSVHVYLPDLAFSQLFFPIRGILVYYRRETGTFHALPGADDPQYVQANPTWSPDGKYIVFAREKAYHLKNIRDPKRALLSEEEGQTFLKEGRTFLYDLYRIPFNEGKGGKPEPLLGASNNGMSNYFPKYSPDGKWIIFCKAKSFMLLQPDSQLYIIPAEGGQARRLRCNTQRMNSWHSWSPNGRWLVFSSKAWSPYTQLLLTHIDEQGRSTPPVLLDWFTASNRAANIPEFVNCEPGAIKRIREQFLDDISFHRAGVAFGVQHDYEGSVGAFRKGLAINPKNAYLYFDFGLSLLALSKYQSAEEAFQKASELNHPNTADVHHAWGVSLMQQRKYEEAKAHFLKVIELQPDHKHAHYNLATVLGMQRKRREAIEHFREALRIDPEYVSAHLNLGTLYLDIGNLQEGERHLSEAVRLEPDDAQANCLLGIALDRNGKPDQAVVYYTRALEQDPEYSMALVRLASIRATSMYQTLRDANEAIELATRACELTDYCDPTAVAVLADGYAEAGQFPQAVQAANIALQLARNSGNVNLADQIQQRLELFSRRKASRRSYLP